MRKFKIPVTPSTMNKCIRFPNHIIESVEKAIQGYDCTFSAFVIEAVKIALENLEDDKEDVYWKGYLNRTQIQYTAKGSSVADFSGFA